MTTVLMVASVALSAVGVSLSAQALHLLTRRFEPPEPAVVEAEPTFDVAGLVAALTRLVEGHAIRVATAALAVADSADLVGQDEADVFRKLAMWKAELVAQGQWTEVTSSAARATIARYRALHGEPS